MFPQIWFVEFLLRVRIETLRIASALLMRQPPELFRVAQGLPHTVARPERLLVAAPMQSIMVRRAQGNRVLIRYLERHGTRLCKAQMVGLCRLTAADRTRLRRNERQMGAVADAFFLGKKVSTGSAIVSDC